LPLGMFETSQFQQETISLSQRDTIVLYTDGVTEAMDKSFKEYGEDRLRKRIIEGGEKPAAVLKQDIVSDVSKFVADEPQSDDLTLMVVKRVA
jgi:sigma-B regulation protein RsbU (phosphoserine phosphatase)